MASISAVGARAEAPPAALDSPVGTLVRDLDARLDGNARESRTAEEALADLTARCAALNDTVRAADEHRVGLMGMLSDAAVPRLVRALHDGLALRGERAELEERLNGLRQRLKQLASARAVLERVRAALGAGDAEVDVRSVRLGLAARRIFQIADDEHEAMTHYILDGPMQRLSDAAMDAEIAGRVLPWDVALAAESVARCRSATVEAASGLQQRLERLWPIDAEKSLVTAVRELLAASPWAAAARLSVFGPERRLTSAAELAAFRIIEAAVDNAVTHGKAEHIDVVISFHRDRAVTIIKDDGAGFDVAAEEARLGRTRGLGLIQMHERAALAGGRLEVRSQVGAGAEVRLTLLPH